MSHQLWSTAIRYNISPNQIYLLDCCRSRIKPGTIINESAERRIAEYNGYLDNEGKLTTKGLGILDEFEALLVKAKKATATEVLGSDAALKIETYRQMFPPTRLPSQQLARQSVEELKGKFVSFFKKHTTFDWLLVFDATEQYMIRMKKQDYLYCCTSSNFIQKTDNITKVVKYPLADEIQNLLDEMAAGKLS